MRKRADVKAEAEAEAEAKAEAEAEALVVMVIVVVIVVGLMTGVGLSASLKGCQNIARGNTPGKKKMIFCCLKYQRSEQNI